MGVGPSINHNVQLINTIIADNLIDVQHNNDNNAPPSGGALELRGGNVSIINSTIVNNELRTSASQPGLGSAIHIKDPHDDGNEPMFTMFNSIIHGNTTTTNTGSNVAEQIYIIDDNDGVDTYFSFSIIEGLSLIHI